MQRLTLNRRQLIAGLAAVPITVIPVVHGAQKTGRVKESDKLAKELGYHHNARNVDTKKYPKRAGSAGANQFCQNCQFYQKPNAAWAPCTVFSGQEVNAKGWCTSWFKRVS